MSHPRMSVEDTARHGTTATAAAAGKATAGGRVLPTEEQVKEMGRKARRRLEEEKSKRKEIVRLHDDSSIMVPSTTITTTAVTKNKGSHTTAGAIKAKRPLSTVRRKRKLTSASTSGISKSIRKNDMAEQGVDKWMPETSGLMYYNLPKEQKSDMVRLHGLPVGTRVEDLQKFFVGLSPRQIFVLLTCDISMPGFDCEYDNHYKGGDDVFSKDKRKGSCRIVERYDSTFRVYVQFPSVVTADVAIQRSGEHLHLDTLDQNGTQTKPVVASISISPLSKKVGTHIQNYLAIECTSVSKNTPLSKVLDEAEKSIPPIVNRILWADAARVLKLSLDPVDQIAMCQDDDDDDDNLDECAVCVKEAFQLCNFLLPPSLLTNNVQQKKKIIELHNRLVTIYEDLERQCSVFQFHDHIVDPRLMQQGSVSMILNKTADLLLDRMQSIQNIVSYYN